MSEEAMSAVIYALHIGDHQYRYVGYTTKSAAERLEGHKYEARKGSTNPVHRWIRKNYGYVCTHVLEEIAGSRQDILTAEMKWIAILDTLKNGLNCTAGGGGMLGFTHAPESIEQIRKSCSGRVVSEETLRRQSKSQLGRVFSDETRQKMRDAWEIRRLTPVSDETRQKMSESFKGRVKSEETCKKLSEAHKGKRKSSKHVANMKASHNKRFICNDCGHESTANNLGYHQSMQGHRGRTPAGEIAPAPRLLKNEKTELARSKQ